MKPKEPLYRKVNTTTHGVYHHKGDRIQQLQAEIAAEQRKMAQCRHDFQKPFYDPETVREPYGYKMMAQGSDVYYEAEGYQDKKVDRWTRKCQLCGYLQHTTQLQPIIQGHEPKF